MMRVLDTLAPVFLIVGLGAVLRKTGILTEAFQQGLNRLVYWVALPALLFIKIADAGSLNADVGIATSIVLGGTGALLILSLVGARLLGLKNGGIGTFIQGTFRANLAFVGLPVIFLAFDGVAETTGIPADRAQALAALTLAPAVAVYNVLAVVVLLASSHSFGRQALRPIVLRTISNPLILSCLLGGIWNVMAWPLPLFLHRTISTVGGLALPAALLCVGGALVSTPVRGRIVPTTLAALGKVIIAPAIGFALATLLGADYLQTYVAVLMLACPTAVSSYIMAEQLGGDGPLAASIIVISTLGSAPAIGVIVALM